MKEGKSYQYLNCPVCETDFSAYSNPTIDDALVFRSFERLLLPDEIYHPHWPSFELRDRINHTIQQEEFRLYLSKLESLARNNLRVKPVDILPSYDRHPLACSVFEIPGSIFSLSLGHVEEDRYSATSACEISLLGLKENNGKILEKHHLVTIARITMWGKAPAHL